MHILKIYVHISVKYEVPVINALTGLYTDADDDTNDDDDDDVNDANNNNNDTRHGQIMIA